MGSDLGGGGQFIDASDGNRVNVGNGDANGLNLNRWDDDDPNGYIGLGASRQSLSISKTKNTFVFAKVFLFL
jgi:hypothetical protein